MRTTAWETASQIVLRNFSVKVGSWGVSEVIDVFPGDLDSSLCFITLAVYFSVHCFHSAWKD